MASPPPRTAFVIDPEDQRQVRLCAGDEICQPSGLPEGSPAGGVEVCGDHADSRAAAARGHGRRHGDATLLRHWQLECGDAGHRLGRENGVSAVFAFVPAGGRAVAHRGHALHVLDQTTRADTDVPAQNQQSANVGGRLVRHLDDRRDGAGTLRATGAHRPQRQRSREQVEGRPAESHLTMAGVGGIRKVKTDASRRFPLQ